MRWFLNTFYADVGLIQSRDPTLLQSLFDVLVEIFERIVLHTNTKKTMTIICILGKIRTSTFGKYRRMVCRGSLLWANGGIVVSNVSTV